MEINVLGRRRNEEEEEEEEKEEAKQLCQLLLVNLLLPLEVSI